MALAGCTLFGLVKSKLKRERVEKAASVTLHPHHSLVRVVSAECPELDKVVSKPNDSL